MIATFGAETIVVSTLSEQSNHAIFQRSHQQRQHDSDRNDSSTGCAQTKVHGVFFNSVFSWMGKSRWCVSELKNAALGSKTMFSLLIIKKQLILYPLFKMKGLA